MHRLLLIALVVAACGEPTKTQPDASLDPDGPPLDAMPTGSHALVVAGDFMSTGVLTKLDTESLAATENVTPPGGVGGDPVIRKIGNRLYVINRFGGNSVTVYNAESLAFIEQYSTGTSSNPQDVAVVGAHMYVAALGGTGVIKIKVSDGTPTAIDLGTPLGDPDTNPDCVSVYAVGTTVYVACALLDDNFAPRGDGKVAVIDTTDDSVTAITMPVANPQNFFVRSPEASVFGGDLLIGTTPSYTSYTTGCIVRVSTGASPAAICATGLANSDVGGFQTHIDVAPDGELLWLAVGTLDESFTNPTGRLMGFDLTDGVLWEAAISPTTQLISDVAACPDGSVVAIDRTMNKAGMRVYKDNLERTTDVISIGLPPAFGNNAVCY